MYRGVFPALDFTADFPPAAPGFINVRTVYTSKIWAQLTKIFLQNQAQKDSESALGLSGGNNGSTLKIKEHIYRFIGKYEIYAMAVFRFLVAFLAFSLINHQIGYMDILKEYPIALLCALLCSFLPSGMMLFSVHCSYC